jgi:hypothetical protein
MKKRILSFALTLVMVLTFTPTMPEVLASMDDFYADSELKAECLSMFLGSTITYLEEITSRAQSIVEGITGDYDKAKAIHTWVAGNVWYNQDWVSKRIEPLYTLPLDVLEHRHTTCHGYTLLTAALLRAIGIPALYVRGSNSNGASHAWNEAYVDGRWIIMDTTYDTGNVYWEGTFSEQWPSGRGHWFDISVENRLMGFDNWRYSKIFARDGALEEIILPDGITHIVDYMFYVSTSLTSVVIPDSATSIGSRAFTNCISLTSVTIGNGVTSIGSGAFSGCENLTSITIPNNVTDIHPWAFNSRYGLTIYGDVGSYAETYARQNNIPFVSLGGATPISDLTTASTWAHEGITSAIEKGFVPEDIQGEYTNVITRQEFCRMAVKWVEYALGKDIDTILAEKGLSIDPNAFTDTDNRYILAAFALGITAGTGEGIFSPDGEFNREQAATMIMNTARAIGADVSDPPASSFGDLGTAAGWSHTGISFVQANGIMQGVGNNNFDPKAKYTREQSIVTFDNIMHDTLPGR